LGVWSRHGIEEKNRHHNARTVLSDRRLRSADDALVDEIAIIGTAEECHERIREAAEGGIHTHIIASLSQDPERVNATFEAFAPDRFSF